MGQKQAEVLNAMAHINYQMRQNWKLLSWRYRILGTLTQKDGWPGGADNDRPPNPRDAWCPQNKKNGGEIGISPGSQQKPACRGAKDNPYYFVCVSNDAWKRGVEPSDTSMCELVGQYVPPVEVEIYETGPMNLLATFAIPATNALRALEQKMQRSCPVEKALNYLTAQLFLTQARLDQKDRKVMMEELYKKTLFDDKDLDGAPIYEGVKKVFYHNLSESNRESVGPNVDDASRVLRDPHNSFSQQDFGQIFHWINTAPTLNYLHIGGGASDCSNYTIYPHTHYGGSNSATNLASFFRDLKSGNSNPWASFIQGQVQNQMEKLFLINNRSQITEDSSNPLATMTLGFYKDPNKQLYYGLYADMEYQKAHQLFGLWGDVRFKASSFAKPFGGRFGPDPGRDPLIPYRLEGGGGAAVLSYGSWRQQPNYSRWPGDKLGLVDSKLHRSPINFLNKQSASHWQNNPQVYTVDAFLHLAVHKTGNMHDPLAHPIPPGNSAQINHIHFMRMMELMALWPDAYDIAHYSILGNYMGGPFPKVCKLLSGRGVCNQADRYYHQEMPINSPHTGLNKAYVRGDFGWTFTYDYMQKNRQYTDHTLNRSPRDKFELSIAPLFLKDAKRNGFINTNNPTYIHVPGNRGVIRGSQPKQFGHLTQGRIFYPWLAQKLPDYLLSSWAPTSDPERYGNYNEPELDSGDSNAPPFMRCDPHVQSRNMPVPSSCVGGGRSGYSVKLISCDIVRRMAGGGGGGLLIG